MNPIVRIFQDLVYYGMERFGKYYSSYRAFVYKRDDPEGYGRLQLYIPDIYGVKPYTYWAWQVGTPAGMNYGWHWIPQEGELVYVEFEGGDPRKPLWKYGHFGSSIGKNNENHHEISPELRDPDKYWFRTPKGMGIMFDDKTKEIKVYGGELKYVSLGTTIIVGKNKIEVTDTGINITAGDGKVYVAGDKPVLYAKNSGTEEILQFDEIGVSKKVRVSA